MQVELVLNKYFVYDKIFNLLDYGQDYERLHHDIKLLTKESYENNYRFVFAYYDVDYYITKGQPGLQLRNLQRILRDLDISNYFCLILTQQNIQTQLDQLRVEETDDSVSIASIQHNLQDILYYPFKECNLAPEKINKHYMSLNLVRRYHRTLLYGYLKEHNLLDQGIVSYCSHIIQK